MASVQKAPPTSPSPPASRNDRRDDRLLLGLILGVCLLYGAGLGRIDLWAPDEPRYGAIAEELRSWRHGASGLVLLHLNDSPYTQKPPLYFWLAAMFGAPFEHVGEAAARAPSAIFGVLCVALTALVGRVLLRNPTAALIAAGLLATSFRFAFTARRAQLDVLLTGFELIAIASFVYLEFQRGGIERARRHTAALSVLHGALGAAALTKGPVGWIPLLVFLAYLCWEGRIRAFRAIAPFWAVGLSVGPLAVWILAAIVLAPDGFAEQAIRENLIGRFFSGTSHARPLYYFAYQLPLDFLPWSLLLPLAIPVVWRSARTLRQVPGRLQPPPGAARFLIVWIAVPLLFFSLSAGKRGLYLLPIFPALAMVAVAAGMRASPGTTLASPVIRKFAAALLLVGLLEAALFTAVLPLLDTEKSPRPIAEAAAARAEAGEKIGVYGMSPLEGGIAYYSSRPVASLRDESQLRAYLRDRGRLVILRAAHLEELGEELALVELASFRAGGRRLVLATRLHIDPNR